MSLWNLIRDYKSSAINYDDDVNLKSILSISNQAVKKKSIGGKGTTDATNVIQPQNLITIIHYSSSAYDSLPFDGSIGVPRCLWQDNIQQ